MSLRKLVDLCVLCIGCGSARAREASIPTQVDFVFDMPGVSGAVVAQHSYPIVITEQVVGELPR